jgi:GNAT superfamily N-acetyltransferase
MADCSSRGLRQEVTFMVHDDRPVGPDGVEVVFDDARVVSDAGVMLVATLARRLGVEALAQQLVLDALLGRALERAWQAGAGPSAGRLVIDVDSFVGEVCGDLKQGAAYGYTKRFGYQPILATRADTRKALHIRLRKGSANTQKGMLRLCDELIARVRG